MTRGRIAVIIDYKTLLMSTEFNGDMYPEYYGHGLDVYNKLLKTENETEYRGYVYEFNNDFFQYNDSEMFYEAPVSILDFSKDYFENWFSDYVYIKNLSDIPIRFIEKNTNRESYILPKEVKVFNFGEEVFMDLSFKYKREIQDRLCALDIDELDLKKSYDDILAICREYDEKYDDMHLVDYVLNGDIVNDEFLSAYIRDCEGDLNLIKNFISDVEQDDYLYFMKNTGTIRNLCTSDLKDLINDLDAHIEDIAKMQHESNENSKSNDIEQD